MQMKSPFIFPELEICRNMSLCINTSLYSNWDMFNTKFLPIKGYKQP